MTETRNWRAALRNRAWHQRDRLQKVTPTGLAELLREKAERREERRLLAMVRGGNEVCWPNDESEPMVTVAIPTYNRGQLIVDRAISAALAQTYERIEVLVVGDHCDEATEAAVRSVRDKRLRFVNLPARGIYPSDTRSKWMVAGTAPANTALLLAEGSWIAPCDDDDEFTPDHVEVLLRKVIADRAELVFSKARLELGLGDWREVGSLPLRSGQITHGSVLYSSGLRFMQYSNTSWKIGEPSDWNRWKRMRAIGVRMTFLDQLTYIHYVESPHRSTTQLAEVGR
jgi:hypothetical protein